MYNRIRQPTHIWVQQIKNIKYNINKIIKQMLNSPPSCTTPTKKLMRYNLNTNQNTNSSANVHAGVQPFELDTTISDICNNNSNTVKKGIMAVSSTYSIDSSNSYQYANRNSASKHNLNNTNASTNNKQKVVELISENVQLKINCKQSDNKIRELQQLISNKQQQIQMFLRKVQATSLDEAVAVYYKLRHSNVGDIGDKAIKINTNKQQTLEQLLLTTETEHHHTNQIQKNIQKLHSKYNQLTKETHKQNTHLKQQLRELKTENGYLEQQNINLKLSNQVLKQDLKKSIQKYEEIQNIIQNKMRIYIEKIREYEDMFNSGSHQGRDGHGNFGVHQHSELDQHVPQFKSEPVYYQFGKSCNMSFGRDSEENEQLPRFQEIAQNDNRDRSNHANARKQAQTQTDKQQAQGDQDRYDMNAQCYRASIQGLLEQNRRLKKSFQALYKLRQGEQIQDQLVKQINIMKSIIQLNQSSD